MVKTIICIHGITPKKNCKICVKERNKKWRQTHREQLNKNKRDYFRRHPDKQREMSKKYRQTHLKQCRANERKYNSLHRKERNEICRKLHRKYKLQALIHYGGSPPKCACCGETHIEFLTIDHIKPIGRKKGRNTDSSYQLYRKLIINGFPEGYRVLCWNCNCGRNLNNGICPHSTIVPDQPNP